MTVEYLGRRQILGRRCNTLAIDSLDISCAIRGIGSLDSECERAESNSSSRKKGREHGAGASASSKSNNECTRDDQDNRDVPYSMHFVPSRLRDVASD